MLEHNTPPIRKVQYSCIHRLLTPCYVFGLLSLCTVVYWLFGYIPFFIDFLWSSYIITMLLCNVCQWLNLTQGSFTTIIYWSYYTYVHMVPSIYKIQEAQKKQLNSKYHRLYTVWICRDHIWLVSDHLSIVGLRWSRFPNMYCPLLSILLKCSIWQSVYTILDGLYNTEHYDTKYWALRY